MKLPTCAGHQHARTLRSHFSCTHLPDPCINKPLLEEHECLGGDVLHDMVGLFIDEVLLEHIDLIVLEHAPLRNLTQPLHLHGKALVLVNLLHEPGVLLRLSWVDGLRPAALLVEHALLTSAHPHGVDLMHGEVGDVVQLNEVGIPEDVILVLEVVLGSWVEGSADGAGVCESRRPSELSPCPCVLVKLSHYLYNLNHRIQFEFIRNQVIQQSFKNPTPASTHGSPSSSP